MRPTGCQAWTEQNPRDTLPAKETEDFGDIGGARSRNRARGAHAPGREGVLPVLRARRVEKPVEVHARTAHERESGAGESGMTAPMAEITTVLPGQTAEIVVQAVNGSSQGVASEPVLVPVVASAPAAMAKVPSAGVTLVEEQEEDVAHVAPLTNGTNGNAARAWLRARRSTLKEFRC